MKKRILFLFFFSLCLSTNLIYAQIGIGTETPDHSSILDISSTNQGVLFPKVALLSDKDQVTVANPQEGLLVYNTGTGGLKYQGLVCWDGTSWKKINLTATASPAISNLQCENAKMSPALFKAGVPYNGTMTVPYSGGNGGSYLAGSPIISNGYNTGLTATLQAGTLQYGSGELTFTLTGTPLYDSPVPAMFNINFLGHSCSAAVSGVTLGVGLSLTFITSIPATGIADKTLLSSLKTGLPVIDGLRMDLEYNTTTYYRPRIINTNSTSQLISLQSFATQVNEYRSNLNQTVLAGASMQVDNNDAVYWTTSAAEVITANVQVQIVSGVWRWYEMKWWAMQIGTEKVIFMSVIRKA
ncbi:hypothetical protein CLV62_11752 [Dysgonomonas alginatilytica]|uniref:Uncharacterized protein n=1 Tax=Dysgonomonas alginatilytica TaxID=1605892 RepID=A0A2V3PPA6_9BACT|nr:hypothetical protein [Dysgonomonas alginatilytica]PXV62836.1 hypothetical protein CLV62_11752 [Dysgonomonas alginatilytica]